jgi:hypothetical protein
MKPNPHYIVYVAAFFFAALSFGMDGWGRFRGNWDAVGKMFLAIGFLFLFAGCTGQPWTPEQAQGYANAAHTVIHGALTDAKDASNVYNNITDDNSP